MFLLICSQLIGDPAGQWETLVRTVQILKYHDIHTLLGRAGFGGSLDGMVRPFLLAANINPNQCTVALQL